MAVRRLQRDTEREEEEKRIAKLAREKEEGERPSPEAGFHSRLLYAVFSTVTSPAVAAVITTAPGPGYASPLSLSRSPPPPLSLSLGASIFH